MDFPWNKSSVPTSTGKGSCVQLWYYMYGKGMGTLNIYQQSEDGEKVQIFSQMGDQGQLWRFAQASLIPRIQPYRVSVTKNIQLNTKFPVLCLYYKTFDLMCFRLWWKL